MSRVDDDISQRFGSNNNNLFYSATLRETIRTLRRCTLIPTQRNNNKNQYNEEVLCRHTTTSTVEEFTTRTTTIKITINNNHLYQDIYIYDDLQYIISLLNKKMVANILQHSTAPVTETGQIDNIRISSFISVCLLRGKKKKRFTRTFAHVSCCPIKISVLFNMNFFRVFGLHFDLYFVLVCLFRLI